MKVLVACEESQAVCKAFRKLGHEAYSCDIQECSGGRPEWHIMQDVLPLINGNCEFDTVDGAHHVIIGKWDMLIAHPPCTRLCNSGQRWLYWGDDVYKSKKIAEQQRAIVFFMMFALADCDRIAIENPNGIMSTAYRKPDCTYNPYDFVGETECKKTCLWLKGLPPLEPTRKTPLPVEERTQGIWKAHFGNKKMAWNDPETSRLRSQTPVGIAEAMAEQWGSKTPQKTPRPAAKPGRKENNMKTNFAYSDIADELCRGCCLPSHPDSHLDPCKWCGAAIAAEDIYSALKHAAPTRRRVPFYSDPRDNVPPAGYVVMTVYDNAVGIIAERQYKRALKNEYANQACGIWYAVSFPVFVQRPDGSLYRPHSFEHDN